MRSTAGVCLGYVMHSTLVSLGVAAAIAAPSLFDGMRWFGAGYLFYLAVVLFRSAVQGGDLQLVNAQLSCQVERGFVTAVLIPRA